MRSNDGAVDSAGRFWVEAFVDPEVAEVTEEGVLMRLDSDGQLQTMHQNVKIPNGISWAQGDKTMFLTDSPRQNVDAFDFDAKTGSISNRRTFFHLDEEGVNPDGHAMDEEENIWHACYGGGKSHPDLANWQSDRCHSSSDAKHNVSRLCGYHTFHHKCSGERAR